MASASAMVEACVTQCVSDALANSDLATGLYRPQIEKFVISTMTSLSVNSSISGADQTVLKAQIAIAAGDPQ